MNNPEYIPDPKYVLHPGYVVSINDGQRWYIGFGRLMSLYGLNWRECLDADKPMSVYQERTLIHLFPVSEGNYLEVLEAKKKEHC